MKVKPQINLDSQNEGKLSPLYIKSHRVTPRAEAPSLACVLTELITAAQTIHTRSKEAGIISSILEPGLTDLYRLQKVPFIIKAFIFNLFRLKTKGIP